MINTHTHTMINTHCNFIEIIQMQYTYSLTKEMDNKTNDKITPSYA